MMNRRALLKNSALAAAAVTTGARAADAAASRVIDAHTHFYDPTRPQGVPWPAKGSKLFRPVYPKDWLALAAPHGARETVVVEASAWIADNDWILDLAAREKSIIGLVGHLDATEERYAEHLERLAGNPVFRGVRWNGAVVKSGVISDATLAAARLLAKHGLELDLNGPPGTLPGAAKLAAEIPDLRIVINHLGASGDPKNLRAEWKDEVRQAAARQNVFMKVSALVEQINGAEGAAPRDTAYYLPVLDHLWECFGEDRLIYGSNWPVSDRGAPYDAVFGIVHDYFTTKGRDAAAKYFWKNAVVAYGVG